MVDRMIIDLIENHPDRKVRKMTKVMKMKESKIERTNNDSTGELSQCTFTDHMFVTYDDNVYGKCVAEIRIAYDLIKYISTGVKFCGNTCSMGIISKEFTINRIPVKKGI